MKPFFIALLTALVLPLGAAESTQLLSSKDAPRVSNVTGLVDFWSVTTKPCKLISLYGYNSGSAGFVEVFDTASTNPVIRITGFDSISGLYTNTPGGVFGIGDAIQLTNTLGGQPAGIYWVSPLTTNAFYLNSTRAKALTFTQDKLASGASAAGSMYLVPNHSFAVASADNYSCVVQNTGLPMGRGLLIATSTTAGTYTTGGTNITAMATVGSP
jgi:hypothetical protein